MCSLEQGIRDAVLFGNGVTTRALLEERIGSLGVTHLFLNKP